MDIVVCGHIRTAELRYIGDTLYCNTGDWVESCTAMVESHDGEPSILHWADELSTLQTEAELERSAKTPSAPDALGRPVFGRESPVP